MLEQLANQFLAMNAKSARNLVGSLSRLQKGGFSITDDQGAVDATEKPRISTASLGYGMGGRNYDSKPFHFIDAVQGNQPCVFMLRQRFGGAAQ